MQLARVQQTAMTFRHRNNKYISALDRFYVSADAITATITKANTTSVHSTGDCPSDHWPLLLTIKTGLQSRRSTMPRWVPEYPLFAPAFYADMDDSCMSTKGHLYAVKPDLNTASPEEVTWFQAHPDQLNRHEALNQDTIHLEQMWIERAAYRAHRQVKARSRQTHSSPESTLGLALQLYVAWLQGRRKTKLPAAGHPTQITCAGAVYELRVQHLNLEADLLA